MLSRLQMPCPRWQGLASYEAMEEHPKGIALLEDYKDHQGFPDEPLGREVEKGCGRLVYLADSSPLLREQHRQLGAFTSAISKRREHALSPRSAQACPLRTPRCYASRCPFLRCTCSAICCAS